MALIQIHFFRFVSSICLFVFSYYSILKLVSSCLCLHSHSSHVVSSVVFDGASFYAHPAHEVLFAH